MRHQSTSPDPRDPTNSYPGKDYSTQFNKDSSSSRGNSPSNSRLNTSYGSESPDLLKQQQQQQHRQDNNNSPGESSRSYSSQKNDDNQHLLGGYPHSPTNDSVGSRSPENLSSPHQNHQTSSHLNNNNNNTKYNNINEMLDHKLQLSFLGPPLAALHSMTEMKGQNSPNAPQGTAANPHGIDSILSRPPPVTSAGLNALASGEYLRKKTIYLK